MPDRDIYERDRERREERDRWPERGSGDRGWAGGRGYGAERGEYGREGDREQQRYGQWRREWDSQGTQGWNREDERWGGRGSEGWRHENERNEGRWGGGRDENWEHRGDWGSRERGSWQDRSSPYGMGNTGGVGNYQRGGSGSEGGYGREQSYGSQRDLSSRGGGTGIRETERWGSDRGRDFQYGAGMSGYSGYGGYGGGFGQYAGRGPKGWKRSDESVREEVNRRLTDHPDIDATEIEVNVRECEVTLTGTVDDRHARRLAEDIVQDISGVRDVHNQIRVQRQGQTGSQGAMNQPGSSMLGQQSGQAGGANRQPGQGGITANPAQQQRR